MFPGPVGAQHILCRLDLDLVDFQHGEVIERSGHWRESCWDPQKNGRIPYAQGVWKLVHEPLQVVFLSCQVNHLLVEGEIEHIILKLECCFVRKDAYQGCRLWVLPFHRLLELLPVLVEAGGFHLPLCFGHLVAGSFQGCRPLFQCVRDLEIRFVCDFQSLLHG